MPAPRTPRHQRVGALIELEEAGQPRDVHQTLDEEGIDDLEELDGGGEWTDEDWFGAVLPGSAYTIYDSESEQAAAATSFVESALEQVRGLAGVGDED